MTIRSVSSPSSQAGPILVVDDHPGIAGALASVIGKAGYATAVFHTGVDALAFARQNSLSAAVIDIHLPDISGLVLSKDLRAHMGDSKPIIIVSGDTSMENLNSLPHVGATYFFSKPLRPAQLLSHLKQLLA